jgi:hypothetical protein
MTMRIAVLTAVLSVVSGAVAVPAWAEGSAPAHGKSRAAAPKRREPGAAPSEDVVPPCIAQALRQMQGGTGFKATYCPVENKEYAQFQTEMKKEKVIESIAENLNALVTVPKNIVVTYGECGEENAFYMPQQQTMVICYELVDHFYEIFKPDAKDDDELDSAVAGAIDFVTYHELGHALAHILDLPITGKEEDAADQLSTYLLADGSDEGEAAVLDGAHWMQLEDAQNDTDIEQLPFWDEHSLEKQRFYNLACWLYGHDAEKYASLVTDGTLPAERAERCADEYTQLARAWERLLGKNLKVRNR